MADPQRSSDDYDSRRDAGADQWGQSMSTRQRPLRLQYELEAANERLRRAAENFSGEWKTFLAYVMKIKQNGEDYTTFTEKNALESVLLHSQGGLVMLRELDKRREANWKRTLWWRQGSERQASASTDPAPTTSTTKPSPLGAMVPPSEQAIESQTMAFLHQYAVLLTRKRRYYQWLLAQRSAFDVASSARESFLMPHRIARQLHDTQLVETRIQGHLAAASTDRKAAQDAPPPLSCVHRSNVEEYLRFQHVMLTHSVSFDRFLAHAQWLTISHGYHLRQRTLEIFHQRDARQLQMQLSPQALFEAAKLSPTVASDVQCPLLPLTKTQVDSELGLLLAAMQIPHGSSSLATKLTVEQSFRGHVETTSIGLSFPPSSSTEYDGISMPSLVSTAVIRTRWEMMQADVVGDDTFAVRMPDAGGNGNGALHAHTGLLPSGMRIDSLLLNEWDLLRLNDPDYLQARLSRQVSSHFERAFMDPAPHSTDSADGNMAMKGTAPATDSSPHGCDITTILGSVCQPSTDSLEAFYALRFLNCRRMRQSLLRHVNSLHAICLLQALQSRDRVAMNKLPHHQQPPQCHPPSFQVVHDKQEGKRVVVRETGEEFLFPAAWRDFLLLETQLLRIASSFIAKQQHHQLCEPRREGSVIVAVDCMRVLSDLYEGELQFQRARLDLVLELLQHEYFTTEGDAMDGSEDAFQQLVRQRPLIDFTNGYFTESYASETTQLRLQCKLHEAMVAHSKQLCDRNGISLDAADAWVHYHLTLDSWIKNVARVRCALVQQANTKWFVPTSVTEHQALQQAIHERLLLVWNSLLRLEIPSREQYSIQYSAANHLRGHGWQFVFAPSMVVEVCNQRDGESAVDPEEATVRKLVGAIDILAWRHTLAIDVYETQVLERIYTFQQDFVDILQAGKVDDPDQYIGRVTESARESNDAVLCPILDVLLPLDPTTTEGSSSGQKEANYGQQPVRIRETVAVWLETQLVERHETAHRARTEAMTTFQRMYKLRLVDLIKYHDLLAGEILEFAAAAPFSFLTKAKSHRHDSATTTTTAEASSVDLKLVQAKYVDEIVDKIGEVAEATCHRYWMPLDMLHDCLRASLLSTDEQDPGTTNHPETSSTLHGLRGLSSVSKCLSHLNTLCTVPRLLHTLEERLLLLRNEETLMEEIFVGEGAGKCAFQTREAQCASLLTANTDPNSVSGGKALATWLNDKLEQLKSDLRASHRGSNGLAVTVSIENDANYRRLSQRTMSLLASTSLLISSAASDTSTAGNGHSTGTDDHHLLLDIPPTRMLIGMFAVDLDCEWESITTAASTLNEPDAGSETQAVLAALVEIYGCFSDSLTVLKMECSCGLYAQASTTSNQDNSHGQHVRRLLLSTLSPRVPLELEKGTNQLLREWSRAFHRSIDRFHERLVQRLGISVINRDIFAVNDDNQIIELRRKVSSTLREMNAELRAQLRCTAMGIALQSAFAGHLQSHAVGRELSLLLRMQRALCGTDVAHQEIDQFDQNISTVEATWMLVKLDRTSLGPDVLALWIQLLNLEDKMHLQSLQDWMDLVFGFVSDFRSRQEPRSSSMDAHSIQDALHCLEDLVRKYGVFHSIESDELDYDGGRGIHSQADARSTGAVSGTSLRMKTPTGLGLVAKKGGLSPLRQVLNIAASISTRPSKPSTTCSSHHHPTKLPDLPIPTIARLDLQSEILRAQLELQWIDDDISHLQTHFETFMAHRHKYRHHQQQRQSLANPPHGSKPLLPQQQGDGQPGTYGGRLTSDSISAVISFQQRQLNLSAFYQGAHENALKVEPQPTNEQARSIQDDSGAFVVPAAQWVIMMDAFTKSSSEFYHKVLAGFERAADEQARRNLELQKENDELRIKLVAREHDEELKRESFAADKSFQYKFRVEQQQHEMDQVLIRTELEQQLLRAQLSQEFEKRLSDMHVQLLAKQRKFDQYCHVMQHDLKQQLQEAQSHLVHQLVDQSGAMSIETKTGFLASLQSQSALEGLQKENLALKQTVLKLQTLYDMQEQTRQAGVEKTKAAQAIHRIRENQLLKENTQLQHQIKKLEAETTNISQDRSFYQIQLSNLRKENEYEAAKRREAKIRSLSAPARRRGPMLVTEDTTIAAGTSDTSERANAVPVARQRLPDFDQAQEAFEKQFEVVIRKPKPRAATASPRKSSNEQQPVATTCKDAEASYQNTTRHYQNEIKRLHQQLAREARMKASLMDQVTVLKATADSDGLHENATEEDAPAPVCSPPPPTSSTMEPWKTRTGIGSGSPRVRAASASICTPRRPGTGNPPLTRPQTTAASPRVAHSLQLRAPVPPASIASAPSAAGQSVHQATSATTRRRFKVQVRDPTRRVGGITGVSNLFSPRKRASSRSPPSNEG